MRTCTRGIVIAMGIATQSRCTRKLRSGRIYERGAFTILRNSKHHQRRFNSASPPRAHARPDMEESASAANAEQRSTNEVDGIGDKGKCRVAAARSETMIGRRISQCTRYTRQSRKTIDRSVSTTLTSRIRPKSRASEPTFVICRQMLKFHRPIMNKATSANK